MQPNLATARLHDDPSPKAEVSLPRILIVDDISDNRAVLARRFQRRNFEVVEADGGLRALEILERQSFDVVLLDVMMPDMGGLEVLQRIREKASASHLPVIMVTAKSQSEDIAGALAFGANDYVTKPVDFAVALARVNTQIERKRAEEAVHKANAELLKANESLEQRVEERTQRLVEANQQLQKEMTERLRSEEKSHYLAHHDALTGLANRLLFRAELEKSLELARQAGGEIGVLFIDLDGFKSINDTLGHSIGDALLRELAARFRNKLDPGVSIARLGGDEFAILETRTAQPEGATTIAGQILELVAQPMTIEGHDLSVGASIGIATDRGGTQDPEDILKNADLAMYRAKADGRNTYRLFDPEMDASAQARRLIEIDLRSALVQGQFQLFYQPIVTLDTKHLSGFEALLRWQHPERGLVGPAEFIRVAEETRLIVPIGDWVLRQACAEAASWPAHVKVAVNISPVQFSRGNVVVSVMNALASTGLAAERLEVEITESVLLEKSDRNLNILNQLHELGVRVSMDDFGTGYSSLSYLRSFRFDKIKIDQSFVRDLSSDDESRAIVRAIAGLGVSFGVTTTAEGVETEDQFSCLTTEGCTEVQGALFGMPMPAGEIAATLRRLGTKSP